VKRHPFEAVQPVAAPASFELEPPETAAAPDAPQPAEFEMTQQHIDSMRISERISAMMESQWRPTSAPLEPARPQAERFALDPMPAIVQEPIAPAPPAAAPRLEAQPPGEPIQRLPIAEPKSVDPVEPLPLAKASPGDPVEPLPLAKPSPGDPVERLPYPNRQPEQIRTAPMPGGPPAAKPLPAIELLSDAEDAPAPQTLSLQAPELAAAPSPLAQQQYGETEDPKPLEPGDTTPPDPVNVDALLAELRKPRRRNFLRLEGMLPLLSEGG